MADFTDLEPILLPMPMTEKGQQDQFRPLRLSGCCWSCEATFAGMGGKEEDAPIPAVRGDARNGQGSTP
jgi:hypothetical protein